MVKSAWKEDPLELDSISTLQRSMIGVACVRVRAPLEFNTFLVYSLLSLSGKRVASPSVAEFRREPQPRALVDPF